MELLEELNRIKAANDIINKDSERLGLRPMNLGKLEAPTYKADPEPEITTEPTPPETMPALKFSLSKLIVILSILASVILAYGLYYFMSRQEEKPSRLSARKFERARKDQPELVISSGNFTNADEAKEYMDRLARKLGVELKILKNGSQYSIQIGPSYANKEDAIVVFDELSRYSVRDLSLKLDSYR